MVDSLDELKSSRSVYGIDFPNFEMLYSKIASALKKIIQNSHFKEKVSPEDRFQRGRHVAFMIYGYFRMSGAHDTALDFAELFSVTLHGDNIQEFDTRWDTKFFCQNHNNTQTPKKNKNNNTHTKAEA